MTKLSILLFAAAATVAAQSCPTGLSKVADTLYSGIATPGGTANTWAGTITTRSDYNTTPSGGGRNAAVESDWTIAAGVLSICLAPGNYTITYRPTRGTGRPTNALSQYWIVGAGGPYTVAAIETAVNPTPSLTVLLTQLRPAPSATGTYCLQSVAGVISWSSSCGTGGGGALSWAAITSGTWASLTSSQWSSLTP